MKKRIVVTGVGLVTPLGADRESSWRGLLEGRCGVGGGRAPAPLPASEDPRAVQLAFSAAGEALSDAGGPARDLGDRWGCLLSCSKPVLNPEWGARNAEREGTPRDEIASLFGLTPRSGLRTPHFLLSPDVVPSAVAARCGVTGPVMNVSSACATGLHSVMIAAEWIRDGRCERALAGSAESSLHPLYLSGFSQMGVLSKAGRVRPFDRARDGFVVGEGAAAFVLESAESALARGAKVYAELAGWDFSCDASHATHFNSNGRRIADALRRALARSGREAGDVGYVNAHGTATRSNDELEAIALGAVFAGKGTKVSSTKGATGHLLGAAGSVELAFSLLALRDRRAPATLHLEDPLAKGLDFLAGAPAVLESDAAATLSFGFGGALGAAVLARFAP